MNYTSTTRVCLSFICIAKSLLPNSFKINYIFFWFNSIFKTHKLIGCCSSTKTNLTLTGFLQSFMMDRKEEEFHSYKLLCSARILFTVIRLIRCPIGNQILLFGEKLILNMLIFADLVLF